MLTKNQCILHSIPVFFLTLATPNPSIGKMSAHTLLTCNALASASLYTATVATPMRLAVLITRHAISPLFAMSTLENISIPALPLLRSVAAEKGIVARLAGYLRRRGRHWPRIAIPNTCGPRKAMARYSAIAICGGAYLSINTSTEKKRGAIIMKYDYTSSVPRTYYRRSPSVRVDKTATLSP